MSNKKKLLIVEDDALLSSALNESLTSKDLEILNINNGLEVLGAAKNFKPDIILLDLILPGIDGFEVLKQLKSDVLTKDIPVFVLSNLSEQADVRSVKALGAEDYFIKANIKIKEIAGIIKKKIIQ